MSATARSPPSRRRTACCSWSSSTTCGTCASTTSPSPPSRMSRVPRAELVTPDLLRAWPVPEPDEDGDKTSRGTAHVIGGAPSTPRAPPPAGLGALRAGAGKLRITTVEQTAVALAVAVPEALVDGVPGEDGTLARCHVEDGADAYVVGPGVLQPGELVGSVLPSCQDAALVLD